MHVYIFIICISIIYICTPDQTSTAACGTVQWMAPEVCVCERERERERECVCVFVCV